MPTVYTRDDLAALLRGVKFTDSKGRDYLTIEPGVFVLQYDSHPPTSPIELPVTTDAVARDVVLSAGDVFTIEVLRKEEE